MKRATAYLLSSSFYQLNDWDDGAVYPDNGGLRFTFDQAYHIGAIALAQPEDAGMYGHVRLYATDENGKEYADNGERAIFFARGVLETVKKLRWQPDVIVCQGWASAVVPFYVKTAYSEEPSFAESKVITALYTNELKGELGTNFKRCVAFRDAKSELLDGYQDDFNFIELGKLAIDYSDGVVEGEEEANQILFDYAKEKNKPVLAYPGEDIQEPYADFINKVCPDAE